MDEQKKGNEISRMPMIGDPAPAFRAMTTKGKLNFPEDYKGSWTVFFSHPADFTPVCTTEFITFSRMEKEFSELNTRLLGLSIDSLHSHLAWVKSVESIQWKDNRDVVVPFPIVADIKMDVAKKYGMLQTVASSQTVRAVFTIDPESVIRAILYYPMSTGRNIPEIIRMIRALQLHDKEGCATPANWNPGDDVLLGAPLSIDEANARLNSSDQSLEPLAWYLTVKKVNK